MGKIAKFFAFSLYWRENCLFPLSRLRVLAAPMKLSDSVGGINVLQTSLRSQSYGFSIYSYNASVVVG
jgi:hypothetical protein